MPTATDSRRLPLVAIVLAGVLSVGVLSFWPFGGDGPGRGDQDGPGTGLTALTPVDRDVPVGAADRDAEAVQRTMAALDPCALLAAARTPTERLIPEGPHACELYDSRLPSNEVELELYADFDEWDRWDQERITLAGAVAYRGSPLLDNCTVLLPVSHTDAVAVTRRETRRCGRNDAVAAHVARSLLARPEAFVHRTPEDRLAPCDLLSAALGPLPANRTFDNGYDGFQSTLNECALWEVYAEDSTEGSLGIKPVSPEVHLELKTGEASFPTPEDGAVIRRVAGKRVEVRESDSDCRTEWVAWPTRATAIAPGEATRAELYAETCQRALKLTARLIDAVPATQPGRIQTGRIEPGRIEPGTQVLYAAGEADTSAVGACDDVPAQAERQCAPGVSAEVPEDAAELLQRAEADLNVMCAAGLEAVREHFGRDMQPTTVLSATSTPIDPDAAPLGQCMYVEPTHAVRVTLSASTAPMTQRPEDGDEVGGHPAHQGTGSAGEQENVRSVQVALNAPDQPGALSATVVVGPDREHGLWQSAPVDRAPLRLAPAFFEDLVADLLGPGAA